MKFKGECQKNFLVNTFLLQHPLSHRAGIWKCIQNRNTSSNKHEQPEVSFRASCWTALSVSEVLIFLFAGGGSSRPSMNHLQPSMSRAIFSSCCHVRPSFLSSWSVLPLQVFLWWFLLCLNIPYSEVTKTSIYRKVYNSVTISTLQTFYVLVFIGS